MRNQADLARGWMRKDDSDRTAARHVLQGPGPYDTACFHVQQATEKYLKAVLGFAGQPIPHIHDLEVLYDQCSGVAPALKLDPAELATLTPYAVQLRYDNDFWPDRRTAQEGLELVERVRHAVIAVLPTDARP